MKDWIKVEDRLPKYCERVLLCYKDQEPEIGYYFEHKGWTGYDGGTWIENILVTHWMPLPKSPED